MTVSTGPEFRSFPLILAAPSGAGKTTIAQALRERRPDVVFSVSATTRPPRGYERDGRDYHFMSEPEFRRMIAAGELAEWAEVHGRLYGTPLRNVREAAERDEILLLDIDVQGARQIRDAVAGAVLVFILPPSGPALAGRLLARGSEAEPVRRQRLNNACREITAVPEFDYVVVNDDLERAVSRVEAIITAERCRVSRAPALPEYAADLCAEIRTNLASTVGE